MSATEQYFVPRPTSWPIVGAAALLLVAFGAATWVNDGVGGPYVLGVGAAVLAYVLSGWFDDLIGEGRREAYDEQVEGSLRDGMAWFIFSEVVVFGTLFVALFYLRLIALPHLGSGDTNALLWPGFKAGWPTSGPGIEQAFTAMKARGIPTINTLILLTSGATMTFASAALNKGHRGRVILLLVATILLALLFLKNQASEYHRAYTALHLTLATGTYGATFFFLTGLHGLHVAVGSAFLTVMLVRMVKGDFTPKHHVGFQAAAWYWRFVGVVWVVLFVVVYCL